MAEKHGYESNTVEELRELLVAKGSHTAEETLAIKGKSALVSLLLDKTNALTQDDNTIGIYQAASQDTIIEEEKPLVIPEYGSEEWQDFLIGQLSAKEKEGNFPKCFGLRRLAHRFLGDIVESGPVQVFAPTSQDTPGRATVVWRVVIDWKIGAATYIDINSYNGDKREFSDVADCWIGNTPATYAVHPSSTAATRAEGRALKKALMLNLLTAEEMNSDKSAEIIVEKQVEKLMGENVEWSPEDKIASSQKNFINKKCSSMDIDVLRFINKSHYVYGDDKNYKTIDEVSRGTAASMIEELNKYQSESSNPGESKKIPEQIRLGAKDVESK